MRGSDTILTVPITQACRRKFHLMQEDSITLSFSLSEAVRIRVGDHVDDELFGRFHVREEQMPTYNVSTGGFDYTLRLDADYWMAENHLFMLTNEGVRKEATWNLTASLQTHAEEICRNLQALGMTRLDEEGVAKAVTCEIDATATLAGEAKHIAYDGTHIISALNQIADTFECEWWFEHNTLHFGKCGGDGEADLDFILAENVESMEISRNQNDYANRIYALGGTQNIPESYGKKLVLNIDVMENVVADDMEYDLFCDSSKKITPSMIDTGSTDTVSISLEETSVEEPSTAEREGFTVIARHADFELPRDVPLSWGYIRGSAVLDKTKGHSSMYEAYLRLSIDSELIGEDTLQAGLDPKKDTVQVGLTLSSGGMEMSKGRHTVSVEFRVGSRVPRLNVSVDCGFSYPDVESGETTVVWEGAEYQLLRNPLKLLRGDDYRFYMFAFKDGTPEGFGTGSQVELLDYDPGEIPFNWYVEDSDDPSSLLSLGERRLKLPKDSPYVTNNYVQLDDTLAESQIVEKYVRVDSIFPKCYLKVTRVTTEDRQLREEYSDGSTQKWPWTAYTIQARTITNKDFPFKQKYVKSGEKLQAVFLSEMDTDKAYRESDLTPPEYEAGRFLLAGMTFDVEFANDKYTLITNESYGAKLPNTTLRPKEGDVFVLTGWDVKNMASLGLTDAAEQRLLAFAREYLDEMEEGQWTFTCRMMSDWPFLLFGGHQGDSEPFHEGEDKPFHSATDNGHEPFHVRLGKGKYGYVPFFDADVLQFLGTDNPFYVPNTEYYIMPVEGVRVRIVHDALKDGSKVSRIIGYELKLDKPYDTPTYTVGETDAFSRLKQLEKQLQNAR